MIGQFQQTSFLPLFLNLRAEPRLTRFIPYVRAKKEAKGFFGTLRFATQFVPEFWMMITGGVPKLILLVEYWADNEVNAK